MPTYQHIDVKGKIYTDHVSKDPMRVLAQTTGQVLVGTLYLQQGNRLLDELNHIPVGFLALTDVWVFNQAADTLLFKTGFLALNRNQAITVVPIEELAVDELAGSGLSGVMAALPFSNLPEEEVQNE
jgi:hypothetical protein